MMDSEKGQVEKGKKGGVMVLAHDTKQYRVRVFTGQEELYGKIFVKKTALRMSKIQIVLGLLIATSQIVTLGLLKYSTGVESCGTGIWPSCITIAAAACVLWTCKKITYMRLHLSMALHSASIIGTIILLIAVLGSSIPETRYRLYNEYFAPQTSEYYHRRYGYDDYYHRQQDNFNGTTTTISTTTTTTTQPAMRYYSPEHGPIAIPIVAMGLYIIMAIAGLFQLIGSVTMASITCKSMCAGRSKMEGKMFAMEIVGREDADAVVLAAGSAGSRQDQGCHVSLPPSYETISLGHPDEASAST